MSRSKSTWWKITNFIALAVIVGYCVTAFMYADSVKSGAECGRLNITISDSASMAYVTRATVKNWFNDDSISIVGIRARQLNVYELERYIGGKPFVRGVDVFSTMQGDVNILISQRKPIARFLTSQGHNFYVDSNFCVLPPRRDFAESVPLITGTITLPFDNEYFGEIVDNYLHENDAFLLKLLNFVKSVNANAFLRNLIVQINVVEDGDIELVPAAGRPLIIFGTLVGYQDKLDKLNLFYKKSYGDMWCERYKFLNLQFENQVICSN